MSMIAAQQKQKHCQRRPDPPLPAGAISFAGPCPLMAAGIHFSAFYSQSDRLCRFSPNGRFLVGAATRSKLAVTQLECSTLPPALPPRPHVQNTS